MYLRGMTTEQISRYCRVPEKRIRRVIRFFEKRHPDLAGTRLVLNDRPAPPTAADMLRSPSSALNFRLRFPHEWCRREGGVTG